MFVRRLFLLRCARQHTTRMENEASYIKKNVPWHILAPRRGCFSNHLPLRRVRILAERLLSYGNEVSHTIKECAVAHSRAEARLLRQPSTFAPSAHPHRALLIVWKRSSLYDNKDHSKSRGLYYNDLPSRSQRATAHSEKFKKFFKLSSR